MVMRSATSDLFIAGSDAVGKKQVTKYLSEWFGWKEENIIDLGDITAARGTEMMMPLWMRLFQGVIGHPHFNYHIVRGQ
jgi:predicted dinucleotide-binding enzyme